MLSLRFGTATDPGRVREVNEDSVLAAGPIAAVADGMGGHAAGEVASRLVLSRMERLVHSAEALRPEDFVDSISNANGDILDAVRADERTAGMGTTLTGVGVVGVAGTDHWIVFNVGDSRVYRLNDGVLTQVTVDHSEVEELVAAQILTADEARIDDRRNIITRSLGTDPAPRPDMWVFPPVPGERFLVCSDGLNAEVDDVDIASVLRTHADAQLAADALVAAANEAGGRDNVTVIVVDPAPEALDHEDVDTAPRPQLTREAQP